MSGTTVVGHTPATHTKGPWKYAFDAKANYGRFESVAEGLPHNDPVILAVREDWTRFLAESEEGQANARLIAAAPEMLGELKQTLGVIEEVLDYGYLPADTEAALRHRADQLRVAIAKAESNHA
jgi:hypothetical protein